MLSSVLGVLVLGTVCLSKSLPRVDVFHQDGAVHFRMQHAPGLKNVHFNYQKTHDAKHTLPIVAKANKDADGYWRLKDDSLSLQPGDSIQFSATALGRHGKVHSPVNHWVYAPTPTLGPRRTRGAVVFRDDFNSYDTSHWDTEVSMYGGMNWEFQVYSPEKYNVYSQNGNLMLKPTLTVDDPRWNEGWLHSGVMDMTSLYGVCTQSAQYGCHREGQYGILPPVMSGKVKSKATIRYGSVEVRARIPRGDWLWPAIWMLPRSSVYGGWPRSGQIDIMESTGNAPGQCGGVGRVSSTLHWGTSAGDNHYGQTHNHKDSGDWSNDFHTWKLDWSRDHIITSIDGQEILRVQPPSGGFSQLGHTSNIWSGHDMMAPFDQDFYLILNVAVGGTNGFFPDNCAGKPWKNNSPHAAQDWWQARNSWQSSWQGDKVAMEIDYIEMRSL